MTMAMMICRTIISKTSNSCVLGSRWAREEPQKRKIIKTQDGGQPNSDPSVNIWSQWSLQKNCRHNLHLFPVLRKLTHKTKTIELKLCCPPSCVLMIFLLLGFFSSSSRIQVKTFWSLRDDDATSSSSRSSPFHQLQAAVNRVLDELERNPKKGKSSKYNFHDL